MIVCPVAESARRFPAGLALEFETRRWTWTEADREVAGWERWLGGSGIGRGDRVSVLSWNRPEVLWLWFALARRGASLVPLNARLTPAELDALVPRTGARVLLAEPGLLPNVKSAQPFPELAAARPQAVAELSPAQELAALFTSGTTGVPSLVPLTVGNFEAACRANGGNLGASERQRWLGTLPLFHVGGLAMAHRCARMGAGLVLERHFEPTRAAALLARGDVTHASFVPTALQRVLEQPVTFARSLEAVLIGGGPMGPALLKEATARGLPVLQTYGLTEACSQVTTERPGEADGATAGSALPGLSVRVVDEAGVIVPAGVVGLVQVQGATVTPAAGDWLETKDLGALDAAGRLTISARRVDLIVSGGENVYPAEIEAVLATSGLLRDVAVAPRPDPTWGQVPVAFVVWKGAPAEDELLAFARERLAGFKVPKAVLPRAELPRNASGKLLRHRLADS